MATGKYDNVVNYFGESVEHYGKKDAQTYFAEVCFQIGSSLEPVAQYKNTMLFLEVNSSLKSTFKLLI